MDSSPSPTSENVQSKSTPEESTSTVTQNIVVLYTKQQRTAAKQHVDCLKRKGYSASEQCCNDRIAFKAMDFGQYNRLDILVDSCMCTILMDGDHLHEEAKDKFKEIEMSEKEVYIINMLGDDFNQLFHQLPRNIRKKTNHAEESPELAGLRIMQSTGIGGGTAKRSLAVGSVTGQNNLILNITGLLGLFEATKEQGNSKITQKKSDPESTDEDEIKWDIPNKKPSVLRKKSSWRGTRLAKLNITPQCLGEIKPLGTKNETLLFSIPYKFEEADTQPPAPYPSTFMDKWDTNHVRMPCSPHNEYPVEGKGGKTVLQRRWELIEEALHRNIPGPFELEEAILTYNQPYANKWNFAAMKCYFKDYIRSDARKKFFADTLPKMVTLALQLPLLCTQPIPLLKQHQKHSITMSQQQAACLLANAFFCTFPHRNACQRHTEYCNYPTINFNIMFEGPPSRRKMEEIRSVINYFSRVTSAMPLGTVTFERKVLDRFPIWEDLGTDFCKLHVASNGTIEDDGVGMLQVEFANKFIGEVMNNEDGSSHLSIRFLTNPEMIISRLFTEALDKNESLLMTGCEQFSKYDGSYSDTFLWDGDVIDRTPRDVNGRRHTDIIALDAIEIRDHKKQFEKWCVLRELNKAYVGFQSDYPGHQLSAVCTGNWGCEEIGGDKQLKGLIQLMAASVAKRDVCFLTSDDSQFRDELHKMHTFMKKENGLSVGNMMQLIDQYNRNVCQKTWFGKPKRNLFEYIVAVFEGNLDSNTDDLNETSDE